MQIDIKVPDGEIGDYKVSTFEVTKEEADWHNLRASIGRDRFILPGKYKKLTRKNYTVMSNTPIEIEDHLIFISKAKGNVLINGLGLGMALKAILKKDEVKAVTVIEKAQEVIDLVAPTYNKDPRVNIIHADAFEYKPPRGSRYDAVWHDIWDDICGDNVKGMDKLHRKYRQRTKWQDSWCRKLCLRYNR